MGKLKVLIVEDEPIIQEHISESMSDFGFDVCERFDDGERAIEYLKTKTPDLVLLDISLEGKLDGIDVAEYIHEHKDIPFIFISSYSDSKTLNRVKHTMPYGYIVKPFNEMDIKTSVEIALYNHSNKTELTQIEEEKVASFSNARVLFFKVKSEFIPVNLDDILWLEAHENTSQIKTTSASHILSKSIGEMDNKLPKSTFIRVHKSYIINITKIEKVSYSNIIIANESIPIGRVYRDKLNASLNFF